MAKKKTISTPAQGPAEMLNEGRIAFVRSVKLQGIGLDKVQANIDRQLLSRASGESEEIGTEAIIKQFVIANEVNFFVVGMQLELKQRVNESEQELLSLDMVFTAKFGVPKAAPDELVQAFANLEARLVLFPYARHFVSDLCFRMSIDPIILPLTSELEP